MGEGDKSLKAFKEGNEKDRGGGRSQVLRRQGRNYEKIEKRERKILKLRGLNITGGKSGQKELRIKKKAEGRTQRRKKKGYIKSRKINNRTKLKKKKVYQNECPANSPYLYYRIHERGTEGVRKRKGTGDHHTELRQLFRELEKREGEQGRGTSEVHCWVLEVGGK